ncbi:hypothetical protein ACO1K9_13935, partial [Staphylococcus aureus]
MQPTVYTQREFYRQFYNDITNAKALVLIQSPYVSEKRIERFTPYFERCREKHVQVCAFIQQPFFNDENQKKKVSIAV